MKKLTYAPDRGYHQFDCGHRIPLIEYQRMKIQPFCALCHKPDHPTQFTPSRSIAWALRHWPKS